MHPEKSREAGPSPATGDPAEEKSEGRSSQEFESRLIQQETEGKTYATREWVLHRFIAFAGALILIGLYFIRDVFSNIFNLLLQLSGSNGFY